MCSGKTAIRPRIFRHRRAGSSAEPLRSCARSLRQYPDPRAAEPRRLKLDRRAFLLGSGGGGCTSATGCEHRPGRTDWASLAIRISRARLVSRCEVRDVGALGAAMPAGSGRLVWAADVRAGAARLRASSQASTAIRAGPASSTSSAAGRRSIGTRRYLLDRYRKAGARYFMAMACHHDNLDLFDSQHHRWNSLRVGPKRDIVGTWEKLVRQADLKFASPTIRAMPGIGGRPPMAMTPKGRCAAGATMPTGSARATGAERVGTGSIRRSSTPARPTFRRTGSRQPRR